MKVIGAGYGRTGTLSLKRALEKLGFAPCYHMEDVIKRIGHVKLWDNVAHGEPVAWEAIFGNYQATVDFPGSIYYQALCEHYPDAKVILTVRDPERWYQSAADTIYQASKPLPLFVRLFLFPVMRFQRMVNFLLWEQYFNGRFSDKAATIAQFNAHIDAVKTAVSPERLLVFDVKDGWEPLCAFLNVPVPNEPFPHVNDRQTMQRRLRLINVMGTAVPVTLLLLITLLIWLFTQI